ncbi:MAG: glycosyltransferase family 39 protein [Planctomycetota bacterium]
MPTNDRPILSSSRGGVAAAVLLGLVYAAVAFTQLDRYGTTWDFGKVFYGERYLAVYLDQDLRHLDFHQPTINWPPGHPDLDTMVTEGPDTCWPLGAISAAVTHRLFGKTLRVLPPLASYDAAPVLWATALLIVTTLWMARRFGTMAGVVSGILLASHPIFFGHTLINFQDVTATATFAFALLAGERLLQRRTLASALWARLWIGAALAAKTNAVFALPILLLHFLLFPGEQRSLRAFASLLGKAVLGYLVVAPAVLFLLWPWLWQDTIAHLELHLARLLQDSHAVESGGKGLVAALLCTPPLTCVLALAGLLAGPFLVRQSERRPLGLLALWCLVPLIRASLPDIKNYDGLRRYLEFVPALAQLGGIGGAIIARTLAPSRAARLRWVLPWVAACGSLVALATTMPWSLAYQNCLAPGLGVGVAGASDFWATSYRAGLQWIGAHAGGSANVFVGKGAHVARHDLALFGPSGITVYGPRVGTAFLPSGGYSVMYVTRPESQSPLLTRREPGERPVHVIALEGRPLLRIYQVQPGTAVHADASALAAREDALLAARLKASEQAACNNPNNLAALQDYAWCLALTEPPARALEKLRPLRDQLKSALDRSSFDAFLAQFEDPKVFLGQGRGEPARARAQPPR